MLPNNFNFYICGRYELEKFKDKKINYFIGFNHPGQTDGYSYENVSAALGEVEYFCVHEVHDTFTEQHRKTGYKMPDVNLVNNIIDSAIVIENLCKEQYEPINILFACHAGISRSTAAAYIVLGYLMGEFKEREAKFLVKHARDIARPNPLMVKIADEQLARNWKLIAPWQNCVDFAREERD